jgi:hypothetical protein
MKIAWLDALLLVVILIGAFNVWRSSAERAQLQPEYERLKPLAGELVPKDPAKVYVQAIPTEAPLEFAWRVYFPPNYPMYVQHSHGSSSSSGGNAEAVNAIVRVRLREVDGSWLVYHRFPFSSGLTSVDHHAVKILQDHPERIQVEQLGSEETQELETNSEFMLLKLAIADEVSAKASPSSKTRQPDAKPFFALKVGRPSGQP